MKNIIYLMLAIIVIGSAVAYLIFKNRPAIEKEIVKKEPELVVKKKEEKVEEKGPALPIKEEIIEEKISSKNPYEQSEAIAILKLKGGKESVQQLEEKLDNPNPTVIMEAVSALGSLEAKDAIDKLETLYEDSMIRVDGYGQAIRTEIIDALGNIKDERAVDFLGKEFNAKESLMYKEHLLDAHEKIGSKKSIPYLEGYLKFIEEHPVKDFPELKFLVNKAKEKTEQIIEEIKNKQ